jgi:hypothetical protein
MEGGHDTPACTVHCNSENNEVEVILQLKDLYFEVETERVRGKIELSLDRPVEEVPWI